MNDHTVHHAIHDSHHWEVLAGHTAELSVTAVEGVADVIARAVETWKRDLANAVDIHVYSIYHL